MLTAIGFSLMGVFASKLANWLKAGPKVVNGLNIGAGLTFVTSGLAVAFMKKIVIDIILSASLFGTYFGLNIQQALIKPYILIITCN